LQKGKKKAFAASNKQIKKRKLGESSEMGGNGRGVKPSWSMEKDLKGEHVSVEKEGGKKRQEKKGKQKRNREDFQSRG